MILIRAESQRSFIVLSVANDWDWRVAVSLIHRAKKWLNDSTLNNRLISALLRLFKFEKQLAKKNSRRTVNHSAKLLLIYLTMTLVPILALANDIRVEAQSYCISKSEKESWQERKTPELIFSAKNQSFKLVANYGDVSLYDVHNNLLDRVGTNEYTDVPHDHIDIALDKNGWLWSDGFLEDHYMHINLNLASPKFEKVHKLPALYYQPYSFLRLSLTRQFISQAQYSHALERIFISGYPASWFGFSKPIAYEIVSGKVNRLPDELAMAKLLGELRFVGSDKFYTDYPDLGGALFENAFGQLIFYDGKNVKTILGEYKNKPAKRNIFGKLTSKREKQWEVHFIKGSERVLLEVISDKEVDLYELTHGVRLNLLTTVDKNDKHKLIMIENLFSPPNSRKLWTLNSAGGVDTEQSLMLFNETDKTLHKMLTIKRPWRLSFGDVVDGGMQVELCNSALENCNSMFRNSKNWRYYFFSDQGASKSECLGTFSFDKPFELNPDLYN